MSQEQDKPIESSTQAEDHPTVEATNTETSSDGAEEHVIKPEVAQDQSSYLAGCGTSIGGLVLVIVLIIGMSNIPVASDYLVQFSPFLIFAAFAGWVVGIVIAFAKGKKRFALGLLTVVAVAFLLVAACFGLLIGTSVFGN